MRCRGPVLPAVAVAQFMVQVLAVAAATHIQVLLQAIQQSTCSYRSCAGNSGLFNACLYRPCDTNSNPSRMGSKRGER